MGSAGAESVARPGFVYAIGRVTVAFTRPARRAPSASVDMEADSNVYLGGMTMTVSKLTARVGLTADTIRYYERAGLLPTGSDRIRLPRLRLRCC